MYYFLNIFVSFVVTIVYCIVIAYWSPFNSLQFGMYMMVHKNVEVFR